MEKLRDPRFPAFHPRNRAGREPIPGLKEHLLKKGDSVKADMVLETEKPKPKAK